MLSDEETAAFDASQPYEILNSSANSQLVFHGTGRFQFVLKIVDPQLRSVLFAGAHACWTAISWTEY